MAALNSCTHACGSNQSDGMIRGDWHVLFGLGIESDVYGPGGIGWHRLPVLLSIYYRHPWIATGEEHDCFLEIQYLLKIVKGK